MNHPPKNKTNHWIIPIIAVVCILLILAINAVTLHAIRNKRQTVSVASDSSLPVADTAVRPVTPADLVSSTEPVESEPVVSEADLIYPTIPYYIEVDKTHQIVTVYTTSASGRYDKVVRQMLCSTAQDPNKFPDGYWKLKEDRCTAKNIWRKMKSHGKDLYAQYATQITGDFLFHSVPYTAKKKTSLDTKRYSKLGTADSGGCVRLTVENAKWISENCKPGTYVHMTEKTKNPALTKALKEQVPKQRAAWIRQKVQR